MQQQQTEEQGQQQEFEAEPRTLGNQQARYREDEQDYESEGQNSQEGEDFEEEEEQVYEGLNDKPVDDESKIVYDFYIDRPMTPELRELPRGKDKSTQIQKTDLFDYKMEVEPVLQALVGRTLEQSLMELTEEYEFKQAQSRKQAFERVRNRELMLTQRLTQAQARRGKEVEMRNDQHRLWKQQKRKTHQKLVSRLMAKDCLKNMKGQSFQMLRDQGFIRDELKTNLLSDAVPWLMKEVQDIVQLQRSQHKDLDSIYKKVTAKGQDLHTKSQLVEKQRIKDVRQEREDKRLYEIALKEAKRKWRKAVQTFRQREQLQTDINEEIIEKGQEETFHYHSVHVYDIDDTDFDNYAVTIPGGVQTQFCLAIDKLGTQFKLEQQLLSKYVESLTKGEKRKASKEDRNKQRTNPLKDVSTVKSCLLAFIKDCVKKDVKFKFHLTKDAQEWVEYKKSQYEQKPSLWLKEKEELVNYLLNAEEPVREPYVKESQSKLSEEQVDETAVPERPQTIFKTSYFQLKQCCENQEIVKGVFELLLEFVFLVKRLKPEESKSKESIKDSDKDKKEEVKETEELEEQEEEEVFIAMTKEELEILEVKDHVVEQYGTVFNRDSQAAALIRLQVPINRVTERSVQEEKSSEEFGAGIKGRAGKKEQDKIKEEQALERKHLKREEKLQRAESKLEAYQVMLGTRNLRKEKMIEDYNESQLEHYYGDLFDKTKGEKGDYDVKKDRIHQKVVAYKLNAIDEVFCLVHNRCSQVLRRPLLGFLKEKYRVFDEVKNYCDLMRDKNEIFAEIKYDVEEEMQSVTNQIEQKMVSQIILDKDVTSIYDFECDHDMDQNY